MMSYINKLLTVLVLTAMLVGACQPFVLLTPEPTTTTTSAPSYTPEFLRTACLYPIPPEEEVECGFLLVPEDRSQPDSRIIRLHVVRFISTSSTPAADPIILLQGGPGSPGVPMVQAMWQSSVGRSWRAHRDVIYIDQRGTNLSIPKLYCPEMAIVPEVFLLLPFADELALRMTQVEACYHRLLDEGINVSAYNVAESAADINDLRIVLGYDKVVLYGFSYGSFLALTIMRQYPESLRSVILDSVWPPGIDMQQEKPFCIQSGIDALFAGCTADEACRTAYPTLEEQFYTVLDRLRAAPIEAVTEVEGAETPVLLDDLKFLSYMVGSLQEGAMRYLPSEITAAHTGDYQAPVSNWLGNVRGGTQEPRPGYRGTAYGMYYSTMCSYASNFAGGQNAACADEQRNGCAEVHPSILAYSAEALQACTFWDVTPIDPRFAVVPVKSDVPTLMLSGTYDCGLPSYLSQDQSKALPNSVHLELPSGHVAVFSSCGLDLIEQFLADPTQRPDASCIDEMTLNWVLPK